MRLLADGETVAVGAPSLAELRSRRDGIIELMSEFGARDVRVFGSVARGEQHRDSDLDLLVDFTAEVGLLRWAQLIVELEDLLGCAVDVVTEAGLRERVRERVLAEAVAL